MKIEIDIEANAPVFAQLVDQIKIAVTTKAIKPGDPLPSIRQLANDLRVNNKTVAKAYQLLERDNVIQAKGYRGSFIHPDAIANSAVDISEWVDETIAKTIAALKAKGVTDSEIRIAFAAALKNE